MRRVAAEFLGTAFLLAGVVGSGIMAAKLAGGNGALALLCNTLPTGALLTVLILTFGPLSGAHFNPAVSMAMVLRRELPAGVAATYVALRLPAASSGCWRRTSCLSCRCGNSRQQCEQVRDSGPVNLSPPSDCC